jgi:hypothetical protein
MSVVRIDWNPDESGYRKFGLSVFIGFTIIGAIVWLVGGSLAETRETGRLVWGPLPWFTILPAAVLVLSVAAPRACRPLYLGWMSIAFVMGTIVSTVILALIYWAMFGFVATIFRLRKRDRLVLREPSGRSTWMGASTAASRERYERQF